MARILPIGLVLLAVAAGAYFYLRVQQGRARLELQPPEQRRVIEGLKLETADGPRTLEDFRGRVVLVDVWASWCGPCIQAVPKLVALQRKHADELTVIGLNVDEDGWPAVERFRKAFPEINYLIARADPEPLVVNTIVDLSPLGQVSVLPTAFLLDRRGGLAAKYVGVSETDRVSKDLAELLAEEPRP